LTTDEHAGDSPANEAIEHLQNAAVEMIKATRAFLDLAEELVADPAPLLNLAHLIGGLAAKGRAAAQDATAGGETAAERRESGVQHIRVS
jgi:hypothetical protein